MTAAPYSRFYLVDKRDDWRPEIMLHAQELWREGKNTRAIATALGCDESEVWRRLDAIKAGA